MKILIVLALIACVSAFRLPSAERQVKRIWQMQPRFEEDDDKIVGGTQVNSDTKYPFIVSLYRRVSGYPHFCGGSIIKSNKVLTAAHCTAGQSYTQIGVTAGGTDYYVGEYRQLTRISDHPNYSSSTTNYDFSVLTLSSSLPLSSTIATIKLYQTGDDDDGNMATAIGWGATYEGGSVTRQLRHVDVPVMNRYTCDNYYGSSAITSQMLCAGYMSGGKDSCQGDSGGPLINKSNGRLIGVVSWGYGCARANYPGIYAKVSAQLSWINSQ